MGVLEGVSLCVGIPMQYVCTQCLLWESWIEVSMSHVFPQCLMAAIIMVGSGAGGGGARARGWCELGLFLCSVTNITVLI